MAFPGIVFLSKETIRSGHSATDASHDLEFKVLPAESARTNFEARCSWICAGQFITGISNGKGKRFLWVNLDTSPFGVSAVGHIVPTIAVCCDYWIGSFLRSRSPCPEVRFNWISAGSSNRFLLGKTAAPALEALSNFSGLSAWKVALQKSLVALCEGF